MLILALCGLAAAACSRAPVCPRLPGTRFVDPEIVALTPAQRAADLAYLVDLLEHSYPHLAQKKRRFGVRVRAAVDAHRAEVMKAWNRYQYMNAVDRMLLNFHDGHLTTRGYARTFKNTYRPPSLHPRPRPRPRPRPVLIGLGVELRYAAGQVVVVRVAPGSGAAASGVRPGDVVLLVGGQPALSRLGSSLRWRGWARLAAGVQYAASRVLVRRPWYPDTPMPVESAVLLRRGKRIFVTLRGKRLPPRVERAFSLRPARCGTVVLRTRTFTGAREPLWKRLSALLDQARSAAGLVLDLRGNRGGSQGIAHRLVARLVDRPVVAGEYRYLRTKILGEKVPIIPKLPADPADPRWTVWRKDRIRPARRPLGKPVAVLTDEVCASSCETVARALSAAPGIRLYGRATAGSSGLPVRVELPESRLIVSLPSWQSRTASGQPVEGRGVSPHVRVPLSIPALQAGRDEPLERALDSLCKKVATPPRPR